MTTATQVTADGLLRTPDDGFRCPVGDIFCNL